MSTPPPKLSELQAWLGKVLTGAPDDTWLSLIVEGKGNREERLAVYSDAYSIRLGEALTRDFPTCARALGEEFAALLREYIAAHPSESPSLADVGAKLPQFIVESTWNQRYPFLADLARLEWYVVEAFYAPEVPDLDIAKLSSMTPEAWNDCSFVVDPSLRVFRARHEIDALWREETEPEALVEGEFFLSVYRSNDQVWVNPLDAADYHLLELVAKGLSFSEICDGCLHLFESTDETLAAFQSSFATWVSEGILRDVKR